MPVTDMYFAIAAVLIFAPFIRIIYYCLFFYWLPLGIINVLSPFYRTDFLYIPKAGIAAIRRPHSERCLSLELSFDDIVFGDDKLLAAYFAGVKAIRESEAETEEKSGNSENKE